MALGSILWPPPSEEEKEAMRIRFLLGLELDFDEGRAWSLPLDAFWPVPMQDARLESIRESLKPATGCTETATVAGTRWARGHWSVWFKDDSFIAETPVINHCASALTKHLICGPATLVYSEPEFP